MRWLARAVAKKSRFVLTFTALVWGGLMAVLVLWLGVGGKTRGLSNWVFLTVLSLVGAYLWSILMWHLFVKPQLEALDRERRN